MNGNSILHPRVSVSLISAGRWPVERSIDFLATSHIDAISLSSVQLGDDPAAMIARIRAAGLRVISMGTRGGSLIESGAATLNELKPALDAAPALACPTVFTVAGPTPPRMSTDEAFDRLAQTIVPARDYAIANGVGLALENSSAATRDKGFLHSLADVAALAREADVGIVVELQNCWYERGLPALFREVSDRIAVVQCSDFLVGEDVRLNRRVPGDGSMPLEWMIGALLDAGYAGYFDLEMTGPAIVREGPASAIRRGVDWLSERLTAWGV